MKVNNLSKKKSIYFSKSSDLIIETTDFIEGDITRIYLECEQNSKKWKITFTHHLKDNRIDFSRKNSHDSKGSNIQSDSGTGGEFCLVKFNSNTDNISGPA